VVHQLQRWARTHARCGRAPVAKTQDTLLQKGGSTCWRIIRWRKDSLFLLLYPELTEVTGGLLFRWETVTKQREGQTLMCLFSKHLGDLSLVLFQKVSAGLPAPIYQIRSMVETKYVARNPMAMTRPINKVLINLSSFLTTPALAHAVPNRTSIESATFRTATIL
jgi:hypothetical protein